MPEKKTIERARQDAREGKTPPRKPGSFRQVCVRTANESRRSTRAMEIWFLSSCRVRGGRQMDPRIIGNSDAGPYADRLLSHPKHSW